ncbi:MAG TPA: BatD family protein, partial [Ignavibacteriales bacterium]|nr:BatD family protein [Ignavibacteriales bacterium]
MKKFLISGLLFFILAAYSAAQTFTAELNKRSVGVNEEFEISFIYSATDLSNLSTFSHPDFRDFIILTGPNQIQRTQNINGVESASRIISYYLQPKKEGTFTIGHASITAGGKTYTTEPISITVTKAAQQSKSSSSSGSNNASADIAGNVFIKAGVDKARAAVG